MSRYIDADLIRYDEDIPGMFIASKTRINNMPTADVRENVKGEWINLMGHQVCSICGYKNDIVPTNFCPNCGAQMVENDE